MFVNMSQLQSDSSVPSTIDMRMESPWPEEMPPVPALPIETQLLLESETTTDSDARDCKYLKCRVFAPY